MTDSQKIEWERPNLMKLRGYEFEEIVPWRDIIEGMKRGES